MREGWELVRQEEYPDFEAPTMDSGRYEGVFGVGGLLLARIPVENIQERVLHLEVPRDLETTVLTPLL